MSTISPFVRIEGSISQPRSAAAGSFPPPFGAEWSLLAPDGSMRADLSALLRTFCLHDETMWSMCHWSSTWPGQPAVRGVEQLAPVAMPAGESRSGSAQAPSATAGESKLSRGGGIPRGGYIAGACVLGGAAILAWTAVGYLQQRTAPPRVETAQHTLPASDLSASTAPADAGHEEPIPLLPPLPGLPGLDVTRHTHSHMTQTGHSVHRKHHPAGSQTLKVTRHGRTAAASTEAHRVASLAAHRRPLARPSTAGGYSPFAPARLGSDEYASVTMPTEARPPGATLASPSVVKSNVSGTEWMNHISQRRVTEVPDDFVK